MAPRRNLQIQSVLDQQAVLSAFRENDIKEVHAWKLWSYILRNVGSTWHDVPDFPVAAKQLLDSDFSMSTSHVVKSRTSKDGETTKLLIELQDGMRVETVVMHYDTTGRETDDPVAIHGNRRATVCVSSQVGCQMGCKFCATGTMGLMGNLTAGEIIEQLIHARDIDNFRNVVFMGMGEPLNNYDAVRQAVDMLTHSQVFGLSRKHVTISTVGVVQRLRDLAKDLPGVSLAFSLHAATQPLRRKIVPSASAYKLEDLMTAIDEYMACTQQKVFVEYVMLAGVNDSMEEAKNVGALLKGRNVTLNLIPFNPVYAEGVDFEPPSVQQVEKFQKLVHSCGVHCTIRQEKGQDIGGACGQLVVTPANKNGLVDVEELAA
ncbi:hypothetical protein BSKO_10395 [Bryopsis sp. KO-2023]|nr:hypothetical protein BSKO_10395 [Bryopsis sp. KO-2023]